MVLSHLDLSRFMVEISFSSFKTVIEASKNLNAISQRIVLKDLQQFLDTTLLKAGKKNKIIRCSGQQVKSGYHCDLRHSMHWCRSGTNKRLINSTSATSRKNEEVKKRKSQNRQEKGNVLEGTGWGKCLRRKRGTNSSR